MLETVLVYSAKAEKTLLEGVISPEIFIYFFLLILNQI